MPFSRSDTKRSAAASARARWRPGKRPCAPCSARSTAAKTARQGWRACAPPAGQRRMRCGGVRNSSATDTPSGATGRGRRAITTVSGTSTVRAQ